MGLCSSRNNLSGAFVGKRSFAGQPLTRVQDIAVLKRLGDEHAARDTTFKIDAIARHVEK